ncbi:hypothetical protein AX16_005136 [Volvariella volvacea WC 439]|nr:hypothetical protein AX16_005136 [Volvariella volvacea WC 439]
MVSNLDLNIDNNDLFCSSGLYEYQHNQLFEFVNPIYASHYQLWDQDDISSWSDFHSWNWQDDLVYPPLYATEELPQNSGYGTHFNCGFTTNSNTGIVSTTPNTRNMLSNPVIATDSYGHGHNSNATGYEISDNSNANTVLQTLSSTATPNMNQLTPLSRGTHHRKAGNRSPKYRGSIFKRPKVTESIVQDDAGTHHTVQAVSRGSPYAYPRSTPARHKATILGAHNKDYARTMSSCPE